MWWQKRRFYKSSRWRIGGPSRKGRRRRFSSYPSRPANSHEPNVTVHLLYFHVLSVPTCASAVYALYTPDGPLPLGEFICQLDLGTNVGSYFSRFKSRGSLRANRIVVWHDRLSSFNFISFHFIFYFILNHRHFVIHFLPQPYITNKLYDLA